MWDTWEQQERTSALRRKIILNNGAMPGLVAAVFWAMYAINALFDVNLLSYLSRAGRRQAAEWNGADAVFLLVTAIGVTVVGAIWTFFRVRRAFRLAEVGIEVTATDISIGMIGTGDAVRLNYQYQVDGRVYRKAMSCDAHTAKAYRDGTKAFVLLYDPVNPGKSLPRDAVFADDASS
jgi:hypothetical protein